MKKLLGVTGLFAAASAAAFALSLLLARLFPPADFAAFALLLNLYSFAALLGDAGVMQKYLRFFLKQPPGTFSWRASVLADLPRPLLLTGAAGMAFAWLYPGQPAWAVAAVVLASVGFVLAGWFMAIARTTGIAWWQALIQRGQPIGLFLTLPFLAWGPGTLAARAALSLVAVSAGLAAAGYLVCRRLPDGQARLPTTSRADGGIFFWLLLGTAAFLYADRFIVAKFCSTEGFALYALLGLCFQLFDLFSQAAGFALAPRFAQGEPDAGLRLLPRALGALLVPAIIAAVLAPPLIGWAYPAIAPVPPLMAGCFAVAGVARVLTVLIASPLHLQAATSLLGAYVARQCLLLATGLVGLAAAAVAAGPIGSSVALAGLSVARLGLAIVTTRTRLHQLALEAA